MAAPEIPNLPPWNKTKVFLMGLVWAVLLTLAPTVMILVDSFFDGDPINWHQVQVMMGGTVLGAIGAYWRRHKAWLLPPPGTPTPVPMERKSEAPQQ